MRTLKINLLYRCTAKCSHCRFNCTNEGEIVRPDFETPYGVAKELKENFGLDMAVVLGGEPAIFRQETTNLLRRLHGLGVATRLETNACWAENYDAAVEFLTPLKEIDTMVMLSLDGFHAPFVSLEKVSNALKACVNLKLRYNLEMPYLDVVQKNHPIDKKTEELFQSLTDLTGVKIPKYEGGIVFVGRAAEVYGDEFAAGRGVPDEICTAVPWWMHSDINSTELLIFEPGGYITKGCGIAIGNVFEQNLTEMLRDYDPYRHPIFSVLLTEGPLRLAKMAEKYGYHIKKDYADKCHLCHEARQILKPYYDNILQPNQHYPSRMHKLV